ncbi:MAG TPA: hypothetical protein VMW83_00155 [Spirochaetia bacterium]|nr:hypothetical protein [Spirochaetia bacterium]
MVVSGGHTEPVLKPPGGADVLHTGGGPEPWTQESGQEFTRWDLWYLVLLLNNFGGSWDGLAGSLKASRRSLQVVQSDFEAKLCHMEDLRHRLTDAGLDPASLVGDLAQDKRILRKARTKILEQDVQEADKTAGMRDTPRRILSERALRGEWDKFPVSPVLFEHVFRDEVNRQKFYSENASFGLSRRIKAILKKVHREGASSPEAQLALYRAGLTALLDAMDMVDDSSGVFGDLFGEVLKDYLAILWQSTGIAPEVYYRDFLNFAVWEDYGLTDNGIGLFFGTVPSEHVLILDTILGDIHTELLCHEELAYEAEKALRLLKKWHSIK